MRWWLYTPPRPVQTTSPSLPLPPGWICSLTSTVSSRAAAIGGIGALGLGVGGYVLVNHCLFNVEGGHRAVMYSRLSGMSPVVRGEVTEPCTREVTGKGSVAHAQVAHDRAGRLRR